MTSRFVSGKGCYNCVSCGRLTRTTWNHSSDNCNECDEMEMHQNSITDNSDKTHKELFGVEELECKHCIRQKKLDRGESVVDKTAVAIMKKGGVNCEIVGETVVVRTGTDKPVKKKRVDPRSTSVPKGLTKAIKDATGVDIESGEVKTKMKRGAHLKPYWDYRKAGGKLSLKDYQEQVRAGNTPVA